MSGLDENAPQMGWTDYGYVWANKQRTHGLKTKQVIDKNKIKMTLKVKRING
jgi:hypothetical protein